MQPSRVAAMSRQLIRGRVHLLVLVAVFAAIVSLDVAALFQPAHNALVAARMSAGRTAATGNIVFVSIDARSLDAIGVWPWPRDVHASIIERLFEAGAAEVFFDVDLSVRSTEAADAALARAIREASGTVILPVFLQRQRFGTEAVAPNLPIPRFREPAWLGAINVPPDDDGRIRRYPYGVMVDGDWVPSVASLMSGVFGPPGSDFTVNYAIRRDTVPTISVIDLLTGASEADLEGKSVVVGAHAMELRDTLPVPVYGILSGAMIQILATETLAQDLALRRMSRWPPILAVAAVAIALGRRALGSLPRALLGLVGVAVAVELLALWLQTRHAVVLSTPVLLAMLFAAKVVFAGRELDLRRWLVQRQRIERWNLERILDRVISDSGDAIVIADEEFEVLRMSASARSLFQTLAGAEIVPLRDVVPAEIAATAREAVTAIEDGSGGTPTARELDFEQDGRRLVIEYTVTPSRLWAMRAPSERAEARIVVCIVARDVTAAREQRMSLDRLVRFDPLTGALNRGAFLALLEEHLATDGQGCAVLAFDMRRFRTINETLGRGVADALLVAMVRRLDAAQLAVSRVGRLGGDRFAVYTTGPATAADTDCVADALAHAARAPFHLGEHTVRSGIRIGIAPGRDPGNAELMLIEAEHALDECRFRTGADRCVFNRATFERQARARRIERAQWNSIAAGEMYLAMQPQVRLADGSLTGAEALSRWHHPTMGRISPAEFVPIAEASGFIDLLGRWVLDEACTSAAAWPDHLSVAVNVSPLQFRRSDVVSDVMRALEASSLDPCRLCLEITESVFLDAGPDLLLRLWRLRELGVQLALDDFGSGFSSLGYLARLPITKLKLDQVFARGLCDEPYHEAVIRSVVPLCTELGLSLLCEGVETAAEAARLRELGGVEAQGYHYGRPMPESAFLDLVAATSAEVTAGR